jgi:chondroitin 4-sulfotransferase 11
VKNQKILLKIICYRNIQLRTHPIPQALQNTLKLLVVRHPFERLLSAYRDKLENTRVGGEHGTLHFYQRFGVRIVAKYRPGGNQTRTQDLLRPGQYLWDTEPAGVEPTFREFVR